MFKTHFPITPNYHHLNFSTPTDTLHIHYNLQSQVSFTPLYMHGYAYCYNSWILHLIFTPCSLVPLLSEGPCLSPLLTTPFIPMAFLKVCALAVCSPPGSVCLYWISCYAQNEMAYHLYPILCTSDAVTACTPVTLFFPLGVQLCSEEILLCIFNNNSHCSLWDPGWNGQGGSMYVFMLHVYVNT